jgi:hypothetical protein
MKQISGGTIGQIILVFHVETATVKQHTKHIQRI